jgi:biopolymer transport protein ExbD
MKHLVLSLAALSLVACGGPDEAPPATSSAPIVGAMELPISLRSAGADPTNALRVEVSPSELRVESQSLFSLTQGRIPAAELTPAGVSRLTSTLQAAPPRTRVALTVHGMVPYGTLARVVQAATSAGYHDFSFAVRPASGAATGAATTGWIELAGVQSAPAGTSPVDPSTYGGSRPFSDFASHWDEVYEGCRSAGAGRYIDCDSKATAIAEGGVLQVSEWARGQGMRVTFQRVGAPAPEPTRAAAPALIEGVRAAPSADAVEAPVHTEGTFSFRADVATATDSAISLAMRPVCAAQACDVVIEGDETTPTLRVLSLLGAGSPDGSAAPRVIFRLP